MGKLFCVLGRIAHKKVPLPHGCNLSTWEVKLEEQELGQFEASLGCISKKTSPFLFGIEYLDIEGGLATASPSS